MIAVIQCAARKRPNAGYLRTTNGQRVMFVADPTSAPYSTTLLSAHPDDSAGNGYSWREELVRYNREESGNPLALLPAIELYEHPAYIRLATHVGINNTYILSAGWGLISSAFLTPAYDITFSSSAEPYKKRRKENHYLDLRMLPSSDEELVFFGGKDYLPLFSELTRSYPGQRTVFYNSNNCPAMPGFCYRRFVTRTRTNWHYECVNRYIDGTI